MAGKSKNPVSPDKIADKASRGEDVSAYFTNKFTVVRPIHRVNVDLTQGLLRNSMRVLRVLTSAGRPSSRPCSARHWKTGRAAKPATIVNRSFHPQCRASISIP